jgi:DNA-binding transcriptional LysR family regulator
MDGMFLPLDLLHTFVTVVQAGSFTRAAKSIHLSQSAVSQQMKRLEDMLGKELFLREGRQVLPSVAGELLLEHARKMLNQNVQAVSALQSDPLRGRIRLGTPEDYAGVHLSDILAAFALEYPQVRVDVWCEASTAFPVLLAEGRLDMALVTGGEGAQEQVLRREPVVWVQAKGLELHEARPLPLAFYHEGCAYRGMARETLEGAGIPYEVVFTSPSLSGIRAAVDAGLAVAPMGKSMVPKSAEIVSSEKGLPPLSACPIRLFRRPGALGPVADSLELHIRQCFSSFED